jgi:hypothetical protein
MDQSFFPQTVRRELKLRSATSLVGKNEERRIKFALTMPLTGGSLVGMPGWLGEAHDAVAKSINTATVDVSFKGMNIEVFATNQSDRQLIMHNCQLMKFAVMRSGESENPDVDMVFNAYAPFSTEAWKWAGDLSGYHFFARFEQTQTSLDDAADEEEEDDDDDSQMSLKGPDSDEFEEERREALQPEHDAEFASAKDKAAARRPRGFNKPTNASVQ